MIADYKLKIRRIYFLLIGHYVSSNNRHIVTAVQSQDINILVEKLNRVTESSNYSDYLINIQPKLPQVDSYLALAKLHGLINTLHHEFFKREKNPFDLSSPGLVSISNTNQQNQAVINNILQNYQNKIEEIIKDRSLPKDELTFWHKLKDQTRNIKDIAEIFATALSIANSMGFSIDKATELFKRLI